MQPAPTQNRKGSTLRFTEGVVSSGIDSHWHTKSIDMIAPDFPILASDTTCMVLVVLWFLWTKMKQELEYRSQSPFWESIEGAPLVSQSNSYDASRSHTSRSFCETENPSEISSSDSTAPQFWCKIWILWLAYLFFILLMFGHNEHEHKILVIQWSRLEGCTEICAPQGLLAENGIEDGRDTISISNHHTSSFCLLLSYKVSTSWLAA